MGRGDNRKTPKTRQRKSWRRNKLRLRQKMEAGKATGGGRKVGARGATPSVVTRKAGE